MNAVETNLLELTESGLYCPAGDFHIDPWRPVERAVITQSTSIHQNVLDAEIRKAAERGAATAYDHARRMD